jgi:hypothetical protein
VTLMTVGRCCGEWGDSRFSHQSGTIFDFFVNPHEAKGNVMFAYLSDFVARIARVVPWISVVIVHA